MIKQRPVVNINPTSPGGRLINEKKEDKIKYYEKNTDCY